MITLYRAGQRTSVRQRIFAGHRQLLTAGEVPEHGCRGFSIEVKHGRLRAFYRNSILNIDLSEFCISIDEMDGIIGSLAMKLSDDFVSYP